MAQSERGTISGTVRDSTGAVIPGAKVTVTNTATGVVNNLTSNEVGEFTVPTTITIELATNPFLRADEPDIQAGLGMAGADPVAVFTELRERKNKT